MSKKSSILHNSVYDKYTAYISKIVLFQAIQFSICIHFSSIVPIDRTLSGATTPAQSVPGSEVNEGVLCIPQSSKITGTAPLDCLVSYQETCCGESYPTVENQSVYFVAPS